MKSTQILPTISIPRLALQLLGEIHLGPSTTARVAGWWPIGILPGNSEKHVILWTENWDSNANKKSSMRMSASFIGYIIIIVVSETAISVVYPISGHTQIHHSLVKPLPQKNNWKKEHLEYWRGIWLWRQNCPVATACGYTVTPSWAGTNTINIYKNKSNARFVQRTLRQCYICVCIYIYIKTVIHIYCTYNF